ncbi:hypothetical protein LTR37_001903 [Vermiconidia calcicola]|uniref:Uncharacterized protein n=1 Tax=Vermiconidia calcicola TaxID=1690605 RepID=A0ACC3NUZ9_9PEZI|nr:hypothetical protein LTR37_001903 [Vermiconidia calcicola]
MAAHNDPKLLYAIHGIKAYHIQNGEEQSLTPSGPQTLSLLMVPTNSPYADPSNTTLPSDTPDEDFYLHLNLPPELDLPLPATTQIYHQPPSSYLIPRWDMGPDAGAFTKIEFPRIGYGATQEDVDTFETILAQCTAFLERAKPPLPGRSGEKGEKAGFADKGFGNTYYNPADYAPGGRHSDSKSGAHAGQIVLVDEDDGSVVGELGGEAKVHEDPRLQAGSKDPVEVQVSADGQRIDVRPVSEEYLRMARHPAYKDSSLVQNAATASRLIVTSSSYIGNVLASGADSFAQKTKPNAKPMEFSPAAHSRVRRINTFTKSTASLSSSTVGKLGDLTQNAVASMSGHKKNRMEKGFDEKGNPIPAEVYKPGFLNKSMIAFSTIADGIATSGKNILTTSGAAASQVVGHKYGPEAGSIAADLAGGVKNVGLVYIDVAGVSRRAVIKSVAKGMVVGKVRGGGEVVVRGGDGGVLPEQDVKNYQMSGGGGPSGGASDGGSAYGPQGGEYRPQGGEYRPMGGSAAAPPAYQEYGQKR